MENVLQNINKQFISLPDNDVRTNNEILRSVLDPFIEKMKNKDPLFKAMYRRVFYGGSYYDGLRVGKPEEFDLDLLLSIPKCADPVLVQSCYPGFTQLQVRKFDACLQQRAYRNLERLLDDRCCLNTDKTLAWMEGLVQKSLNDFDWSGRTVTFSKSGPALTLHVNGPGMRQIDVDLVPCFVFRGDKWPTGFRPNSVPQKDEFFIVPKKPKGFEDQSLSQHWRLSFQEQERVLLHNQRTLKPVIKLLKKHRDTYQDNWIASYYIKTILLHVREEIGEDFGRDSLSHDFVTVLKKYREFISNGKIPYYWNTNYNLLNGIDETTAINVSNRLGRMIDNIERNPDKPELVAKYLLTPSEERGALINRQITRKNISWENEENPIVLMMAIMFASFVIFGASDRFVFITVIMIIMTTILYVATKIIQFFKRCPLSSQVKFCSAGLFIISCTTNKGHPILFGLSFSGAVMCEVALNARCNKNSNNSSNDITTCLLSVAVLILFYTNPLIYVYPILVAVVVKFVKLVMKFGKFLFSSLDEPETIENFFLQLVLGGGIFFVATKFPEFFILVPGIMLILAIFLVVIDMFMLAIVVTVLLFQHFTKDHHAIVFAAICMIYFNLVPDIRLLISITIFFFIMKILALILREVLKYENIVTVMLMLGAFVIQEISDLKASAFFLTLVGTYMLIAKGVVSFVCNLALSKFVIATMLFSCGVLGGWCNLFCGLENLFERF